MEKFSPQDDQAIGTLAEELLCLQQLRTDSINQWQPNDQEEQWHQLGHLETNIERLRRDLHEAILSQQFDSEASFNSILELLQNHDFKTPDDNIDDYIAALNRFQPGTAVSYTIDSSESLLLGEVVTPPNIILVPVANDQTPTCRIMADIEIKSGETVEYESFGMRRGSNGQIRVIGIRQI